MERTPRSGHKGARPAAPPKRRAGPAANLLAAARLAAPLFMLLATGGGLPPRAVAGEPVLRAQVDRARVAEGATIVLTVTLEGFSRRVKGPEVSRLEGFELYDAGRSTNISWVNGRFSSSTTHTYQLVARRAGTYTLPPVTVQDKGRTYHTEPIELHVSAKAAAAPSPGRAPVIPEASEAAGEGGLFARIEVDKQEAFLDQQITLHFRLYQRADIRLTEISSFAPPTTEGFWREDLGQQQDYNVRSGGDLYKVREVSWALFPTKVGELEIGAGRVICHVPGSSRRRRGAFNFFGESLFDMRRVPLTTEPIRIRVKPLPEEGRPASFTGTIGDYEVEAGFDSPEARQGEPFTLTVAVRGTGHVQTIGAPRWPEWEGLRVYDSGEAVSVEKRKDRVVGEKTFTQVLIPTRTGRISLDPVRFTFFHPGKEQYVTVATGPLAIEVLPAAAGLVESGGGEVLALGEDVLYIQTALAGGLRLEGAEGFSWPWLIHLVPAGLIAGAAWMRRRRLALERSPALARRGRALRRARERLARLEAGAAPARVATDLAEALEVYLGDWLTLEVRGMRRSELSDTLDDAGVSGEMTRQALSVLEWADDVRFGAGASGQVPQKVEGAGDLIRDLDVVFRKSPLGVGL